MSAVVLATAGYDHKIRFWEASSRLCTRTIRYPDSQVNCLAISDDKLYIAAGGNPHLRVYDVINSSNNQPVASFAHSSNVTAVGFQHDRSWIFSGSEDGTVKVWDVRAPRFQRSYECRGLRDEPCAVNSVALHPNQGELISGDQSGHVRIWDLTADKCSQTLRPGADDKKLRRHVPVRSVAIASDASYLVAGTNNADVYAWKPNGSKEYELDHVIEAAHDNPNGESYILKCAISPDAQLLVTTSSDKTAKVWAIRRDWQLEKTLAQHQRWVWDACFSADSAYLVTASSDHSARLWDLQSGAAIRYYSGHTLAVTCCALNDSSTS
ncbi:WD40-repeat-containing domain protein [Pelagophyceae sp. CCMP2097]|nr:WD40-repeat-containing domain protein [Pelagophyceae sp. CCMP2097]